jgi:hypothetical protein
LTTIAVATIVVVMQSNASETPAGTCDCGAALPTVGVHANEDGMALSVGETPVLILVNCNSSAHSTPRTFALAIARAA